MALYASTGGPNWIDNTGWLQTVTPCSWFGITCAEGHVNHLELEYNYLQGPIPSELGNLTELVNLMLHVNGLTGTIPATLGNLIHLEILSLGSNLLSGSIPPELGNLTVVRLLGMSTNQLSGPIPSALGRLPAIETLVLYENQLSGPIPAGLGQLTTLEYLSLNANQLGGPIPPELGQLVNLCDLDLSDNQLSGPIPPELGNLIRIGWCRYANQADGEKGTPSPGFDGVDPLQDSDTSLLEPDFSPLPPEPTIGYLNLASNHLSGEIPVELSQLSMTAGLVLSCNQLAGEFPQEVRGLLRWGSVAYNMLTGYSRTRPWHLTQTVPPTDLTVAGEGYDDPITLSWTPIPYTGDGGFYEISYAIAPEGPFSVLDWTAGKTASSYTTSAFRWVHPRPYYFRLRTFTAVHGGDDTEKCEYQPNALVSDYTEVVGTTGQEPTPTSTPTETSTATATPTSTTTASPTPSATETSTLTATVTPTATPTPTVVVPPTPFPLWLPLILR